MNSLRKKYRDYTYKEAALNPTNPRNRAVDWETDIVNALPRRSRPPRGQRRCARRRPGARSTSRARSRSRTRPASPATPRRRRRRPRWSRSTAQTNGFGWKHKEVDRRADRHRCRWTLPIQNANRAFITFMGSLAAVFVVLFIVLNIMLSAADRAADHAACRRRPTRSPPATSTCPSSRTRASDEMSHARQVVQPHAPQPGEGDGADRQEVTSEPSKSGRPRGTRRSAPWLNAARCPRATPCTSTASSGARRRRLRPHLPRHRRNLNLKVALKEYLPERLRHARRRQHGARRASADDRPRPVRAGACSASSTRRARSPPSATPTSCA